MYSKLQYDSESLYALNFLILENSLRKKWVNGAVANIHYRIELKIQVYVHQYSEQMHSMRRKRRSGYTWPGTR